MSAHLAMSTFVPALVSLFVVVEPLGALPAFATMTAKRPRDEVGSIALRASVVGALVLALFAVAGQPLLEALGVRLDAFRAAGGVLLLLTALDMLRGESSRCRCGPREATAEGDVAIVPLAIPLLAGPGAMATTMMLVTGSQGHALPVVLAAIAVTFLLTWLVLRAGQQLSSRLSPSVLSVTQRILGLVLAAMGLQAVLQGARAFLA
jgi:multiple antibiotic resistance protein